MSLFSLGNILQVAVGAMSLFSSNKGEAQQFKADNREITRQQGTVNELAGEDKSDIAREADRAAASAMAAMEVVGGSGSQNEARLNAEIHGIKGIDLARLEGSRRREIAALQSRKESAREHAKAAQTKNTLNFLGGVADVATRPEEGIDFVDAVSGLFSLTGDAPTSGNPHR